MVSQCVLVTNFLERRCWSSISILSPQCRTGDRHGHNVAPLTGSQSIVCHFLAVTYVRVKNFALTISSLMMTSEWPLVKLESFCSFAGVLTQIQSRAWQRPLSSCSSLTTSSTWLAQRRLLPTTSKTSPSGLDFLTVGGFTWALHRPMVTLPPLAPKSVCSREKNLFSTSLFKQLVKKSVH